MGNVRYRLSWVRTGLNGIFPEHEGKKKVELESDNYKPFSVTPDLVNEGHLLTVVGYIIWYRKTENASR